MNYVLSFYIVWAKVSIYFVYIKKIQTLFPGANLMSLLLLVYGTTVMSPNYPMNLNEAAMAGGWHGSQPCLSEN